MLQYPMLVLPEEPGRNTTVLCTGTYATRTAKNIAHSYKSTCKLTSKHGQMCYHAGVKIHACGLGVLTCGLGVLTCTHVLDSEGTEVSVCRYRLFVYLCCVSCTLYLHCLDHSVSFHR
jgi:hypothetical protein